MRRSHHTRFPVLIACAAAAAAMTLGGCREGREGEPATERPGKSPITERSVDLRALIDAELAAGKKRIVIPEGRYRVKAERGSHLHFSNLSDVEIIAENVELVCTSTVRALLCVPSMGTM